MLVLEEVVAYRIIPVISVDSAEEAETLARGLLDGGLPVVEVVLRSPGALAALSRMTEDPALLVGAGTIVNERQLDAALEAGARFLVSPGTSRRLLARAADCGVPMLPGAATGTEILQALELGVCTVKFFPASTSGGPDAVRAFAAPYGDVRFIPTGGITAVTAGDYLALPSVAAVGGGWMAPAEFIKSGNHAAIADRVAETVAASRIAA